jgi:hypothetical protein
MLQIDRKYSTDGEHIINHISGETLPADEPLVLFRGHDPLLLPLLEHYKQMCIDAGSLPKHLELLDARIADIRDWQAKHAELVKAPGTAAHYAQKA